MDGEAGNRSENGKDRDAKGRFVKGNRSRGGRPPESPEFRACARAHTLEALNVLLGIMGSRSANNADRIQAAKLILAYAVGKPESSIRVETLPVILSGEDELAD